MPFTPYTEPAGGAPQPPPALQVPIIAPPPARDRLLAVVREAVVAGPASADSVTARIVDAVLAELCPANHVLITAEVFEDHDPGTDTPDAYEPPYSTAALAEFTIIHDAVEEESAAALLVYAAEMGESAPDGLSDLDSQIVDRFEPQRQAVADRDEARRKAGNRSLFSEDLVFPDAPERSTT